MSFEFLFVTLCAALIFVAFEPAFGVIYFLAAERSTDWLQWWTVTLISMVLLAGVIILRKLSK